MEKQDNLYDVVVIGGGPAGLTAALYLARARYRVVVLEEESYGGQIAITEEVVNYPGIIRISGRELTETMRRQAESFGAEFFLARAERLEMESDVKTVYTSRGSLRCFGVLLATGAHPRKVGFAGEEEYRGRGVAYCATCDGEFFTGQDVYVVGGGFAAAEESLFLTKYARQVTILIRRGDFSCAQSVADEVRAHEKITVRPFTEIESVSGDTVLQTLWMRNNQTGEVTEVRAQEGERLGVFVFAGYEPASSLAEGLAERDAQGYVVTDRNQKTRTEGLYAAGDVCVKPLRQVATAVGDGALAATEMERYAALMQRKTGLHPKVAKRTVGAEQREESKAGNRLTAETANRVEAAGEKIAASAVKRSRESATGSRSEAAGGLFTEEMLAQLHTVFSRMERPLLLRLQLDKRLVSRELRHYMDSLAALTDRLRVEIDEAGAAEELPCVRICTEDGAETGLAFHGVPGGHEFTSFVLGLYNAAGPGQSVDSETMECIRAIDRRRNLKILVSLSCTMCPALVAAAWRIAAANPLVTAEVYDINHFTALKERYQVMSVPCLVIDGETVTFGKKDIRQILELL
ncbi:MAG: FAD-dependent oxidoreductase [Lachnospiraceae bacterium]|nr:FAD-dependent oxidoreductase [Lachnospiraceae bacterium]